MTHQHEHNDQFIHSKSTRTNGHKDNSFIKNRSIQESRNPKDKDWNHSKDSSNYKDSKNPKDNYSKDNYSKDKNLKDEDYKFNNSKGRRFGNLWMLNGMQSLNNLNFNQLVYSKILSSQTFKNLKQFETMADFGKYLKKCITFPSSTSSVSSTSMNASNENENGNETNTIEYPSLKFLEMGKNVHNPQILIFEWLLKLHLLWRALHKDISVSNDENASTLDGYVQNVHFEQYLQSKSNIIWIEIALYCLWIRFMVEPNYQFEMYKSLFYSQRKKMESIPIFCKFDGSSIEKITMPIFVKKLIANQKALGTILPRLPKKIQDELKWKWENEMRNLGISLKWKQTESNTKEVVKEQKEVEEASHVEKIEITEEGRSRFSQKPKSSKGFLDLSRYVSSQYSGDKTETILNYNSKDVLTIGRPTKKRRIGL